MASTGMGAAEYWGRWTAHTDRIHIEGTKRAGRVRDVPLVLTPARPSMHRRTFEDKVRERAIDITPYDLRRTYANWLEAAGIPRTRRRLYRGHGAQDVGDLYEAHEVAAFLAEDAARLKKHIKFHGKSHGRRPKKAKAPRRKS
jgi:integrase